MINHIITKLEYEEALKTGYYEPSSYNKDGFIHFSNIEQVIKVANYNFKGKSDLLLLYIDETIVKSKVIYEDLYELNENYPHIYGQLNLDAIISIKEFKEVNGTFEVPE